MNSTKINVQSMFSFSVISASSPTNNSSDDDSGSGKETKFISNFKRSTKIKICHDYIRNLCPHKSSRSCKYKHPRIKVLQDMLQSALLNSDTKTAQEIQRKIDEMKSALIAKAVNCQL